MYKPMKKYILILSFIMAFTALFFYAGCSDDSSPSGGTNPSTTQVSLPLDNALSNVQLVADQTTHLELALQIPPEMGVLKTVEIDIGATMENTTITVAKKISNIKNIVNFLTMQSSAEVSYKVGSDPQTVCQSGIVYGPYSMSAASIEDSDPDNITLDAATVEILNYGTIVVCMEITSTVNASFSIDQVEANVTQSDCGTTSNFNGVWTGTYSCGNSCGSEFGGDVQITITQNGNNATYTDDSGDTYTGKICGDVFTFDRINSPGETEGGTLVLTDATHAVKNSTWRETFSPFCTGDCLDSLVRVSVDK